MQRGYKEPLRRIGLIVKGNTAHPSTAHIRLLRPLEVLAKQFPIDARPVSISWLLKGGITKLDAVIVQRDALPPEYTDALIEALRIRGKPLLYEIDDLLWEIPPDHGDHGIKDVHKVSMKKLIRAATIATASTDHLADALREQGCPVNIIPNGLDETLWASPLPADFLDGVGAENGLIKGRPTLLYMGTTSHSEDLKMIAPAVERLRSQFTDLHIVQIGGGTLLPGAREIKVPYEALDYPDFVLWFRAVCSYVTIAIAPLRDNSFNLSKSDIKCLDYGFGLVPAVYSKVGPYQRSVVDGVNGLLCENDSDAWYIALNKLLCDAELRAGIKARSLVFAQERGVSRQTALQWQSILTKSIKVPRLSAKSPLDAEEPTPVSATTD